MLRVLTIVLATFGAEPMALDGQFNDWQQTAISARDPAGDATGAFDLRTVRVTSRGDQVFVWFDLTKTLNLQSGPDSDGTLTLDITVQPSGKRITADLRSKVVTVDGQQGRWNDIGLVSAPTYASDQFELRFAVSRIPNAKSISLNFSGSDSLVAPVAIELTQPQPVAVDTPTQSFIKPSGAFRVASLNVLRDGMFKEGQQASLARLFDAVDADIYCMQELYRSETQAVVEWFTRIDPLDNAKPWNIHRQGNCAVLSQYPLQPIETNSDKSAAAVVHLPTGPVHVLSIHPICCGYAGSEQDVLRIRHAQDVVKTIQSRDLPAVVVGDWNLVGSRTPLDIIETQTKLTPWLLRHFRGVDTYTWYDESSSFGPGRLDLVAFDLERLKPVNGFVLNIRMLAEDELRQWGLQPSDAFASDHMMLVTDFAR